MNAKQTLHTSLLEAAAIPFDLNWANGTGYMDHAVRGEYAPKLEIGQVVKTTDNHNRTVGMVGTEYGNVVVFDRFTDPDSAVVVSNVPTSVARLLDLPSGSLGPEDVLLVFGHKKRFMDNVGLRLKALSVPEKD